MGERGMLYALSCISELKKQVSELKKQVSELDDRVMRDKDLDARAAYIAKVENLWRARWKKTWIERQKEQ